MTVKFGFYDSLNGDRLYNANDINTFFEGVFSDGVFEFVGGALAVEHSPGTMNVLVNTGRAWFNNLWLRNTSTLTLAIEPSSLIHPRKDLVVLEFDSSITVRENSIKVLTGIPAAVPIAPTLANTSTLHQYALAEIYVNTGVSEINAIDITNKIGTVGTPYATSLLSEPSTAPPTTALNDFQLGDGSGNWITKTLDQTVTILRTILDSVYSLTSHTHDASGIVSGILNTARIPVPTTTTIGGVKRNAGSAGQYVNGIDATGGLTYATPSGGTVADHAVVNCTTANSIASGAYPAIVPINSVVKDNNTMTGSYRITIKKAGLYEILGVVIFNNAFPDRTNAQALILVNGVLDSYQITYVSHATGAADQPGMSRIVYYRNLSVGDYVQLVAFQNTGASVQLGTTLGYPQLSVKQQL